VTTQLRQSEPPLASPTWTRDHLRLRQRVNRVASGHSRSLKVSFEMADSRPHRTRSISTSPSWSLKRRTTSLTKRPNEISQPTGIQRRQCELAQTWPQRARCLIPSRWRLVHRNHLVGDRGFLRSLHMVSLLAAPLMKRWFGQAASRIPDGAGGLPRPFNRQEKDDENDTTASGLGAEQACAARR
jgi:hypothetical protein